MRRLLATVAILVALPVAAQPPDGAADIPAAVLTPEPPAPLATPADTPTRRPTHAPTPTAAAIPSPADTETVTASPTSTPSSPPTPMPTAVPPAAPADEIGNPSAPFPALRSLARAVATEGSASTGALGAVLALLAVWLGARLGGARTRAERRRARRTLATALLLELRRIDAVLRRVVTLDNAGSFPPLEHPIMEAVLRDLTLFQTATAARIAQFHSALRSIQHEIGDYRDNPLRWAGRLTELHQLIKARSATACRAVPELVKALEHEGGKPPPPLPEPPSTTPANPAGLPPPPFGAHEGDDWTL